MRFLHGQAPTVRIVLLPTSATVVAVASTIATAKLAAASGPAPTALPSSRAAAKQVIDYCSLYKKNGITHL